MRHSSRLQPATTPRSPPRCCSGTTLAPISRSRCALAVRASTGQGQEELDLMLFVRLGLETVYGADGGLDSAMLSVELVDIGGGLVRRRRADPADVEGGPVRGHQGTRGPLARPRERRLRRPARRTSRCGSTRRPSTAQRRWASISTCACEPDPSRTSSSHPAATSRRRRTSRSRTPTWRSRPGRTSSTTWRATGSSAWRSRSR